MIALIDYGSGNLRSAEKALTKAGARVAIVNRREDVLAAAAVVLPGVGAFGDCVKNLTAGGLAEAIREFIASGRPFLGICVGLQMLFESGAESPGVAGLGVLPGTVPRFAANGLKVPHMGWNRLRIRQPNCPLLAGVADGSFVYFVHSYYGAPRQESVIAATTEYGVEFSSVIWRENVFATQFHPEKSQAIGLKMLENFVGLT
ncbi:MAG: Imidazole glycerol phosphate synthase subunit HisH [Verrucomicrobiae bacterium]|nr:Imidazole glycerol phosphate synthase subunit HisH [Verrucomicrobiae bacterium]